MKKKILSAVVLVSLFSAIDRALGFIFKIYLSREMGATAVGIYQVAVSLFMVLLSLLTSGLPLAISKLTAKYAVGGKVKNERALVSAGLVIQCVLSGVIIIAVIALKTPITAMLASAKSYTALLFLLPALLFSAIAAAIKGNLWGHENYFIGSIGEIVEQLIRFVICIAFFTLGYDKLGVTSLSLSVGCFFSMLIVLVYYLAKGSRFSRPNGYITPLIRHSAPITVSRAVSGIVSSISAIVVPMLLIRSGLSEAEALSQYGASVGMALPLLFLPITAVGAISYVLVPSLSADNEKKDNDRLAATVQKSVITSVMIACGCLPLFLSLGKAVGVFLYDSVVAGEFLVYSAYCVIPLAVESITSSQMNALDLEIAAFVNYLIGAAVQYAVMLLFINNFSIYVLAITMTLSLAVTSILNIAAINKKLGKRMRVIFPSAICLLGSFPCTFITKCIFSMLSSLPVILSLSIAAIAGLAFYVGLCYIFIVALDVSKSKRIDKRRTR